MNKTETMEKFNKDVVKLINTKNKLYELLNDIRKTELELSNKYRQYIRDSKTFRIASFSYNHATKDYIQIITVYIDCVDLDGIPDSIRYDLDVWKLIPYLQTSDSKPHIKEVIEHCSYNER